MRTAWLERFVLVVLECSVMLNGRKACRWRGAALGCVGWGRSHRGMDVQVRGGYMYPVEEGGSNEPVESHTHRNGSTDARRSGMHEGRVCAVVGPSRAAPRSSFFVVVLLS
ncbi:hypothetical protein PLESTB_000385100 [Pleodorina starrii]|uniref:Secreted protein n=1 Tax=Pleodorina starrii TaxID=330485 RepID=A0A9W6EYY8_9CHLO|nr:hypothetical protein PLESTM_000009700 [Pleodorina starrii]GLC50488.1 hypothetical protein PLESTB_000385100 [Pleodorina starrii]GLC73274.1 hypothetical protein PLESTF_001354800 [Pleodorina starrii]